MEALEGVAMELEDGAFPLLHRMERDARQHERADPPGLRRCNLDRDVATGVVPDDRGALGPRARRGS